MQRTLPALWICLELMLALPTMGCEETAEPAASPTAEDTGPADGVAPTEDDIASPRDAPEPDTKPRSPATLAALSYDFGDVTLDPGQEASGWCQSWNLNNPEALYINSVSLDTDGGYHHSNWFFVPEGKHDYPDGLWKGCYGGGFSEIEAALNGGVIFAQSTQVTAETQIFREGTAVRIPPWSRIIGATHVLNASVSPLTTGLRMTIQPLPKEEVTTLLTPFRLSYLDLLIPPKSDAVFTGECDFANAYEAVAGEPMNIKIHWVLPHYHVLGTGFTLDLVGGSRDGERVFELGAWAPEPFGKMFDTPFDLTGAEGFRFTCSYSNPHDKNIKWGIGDNEMCVMLGFAESKTAFDMSVLETKDLTTDAAGVVHGTGGCTVIPVPYDPDKDGGLPPNER